MAVFNSCSQFEYAMPMPKPIPMTIGHARLLKNNNENTVPRKAPPPKNKTITNIHYFIYYSKISDAKFRWHGNVQRREREIATSTTLNLDVTCMKTRGHPLTILCQVDYE